MLKYALSHIPYILACHLQIDADLDPVPQPAYHFDADPDPDFHFHADSDADLDCYLMRKRIRMRIQVTKNDADPAPHHWDNSKVEIKRESLRPTSEIQPITINSLCQIFLDGFLTH